MNQEDIISKKIRYIKYRKGNEDLAVFSIVDEFHKKYMIHIIVYQKI